MAVPLPTFPAWSRSAAILAAALCQWSCSATRDDLFLVDPSTVVRTPTSTPAAGSAAAQASAGSGSTSDGGAADSGSFLSSGAGAGGSSGAAVSKVAPFRWTETIPGAGACQASTFMGQFECTVTGIAGTNRFAGTITLVLKGSSESQFFNVDRGQILVFDEDMKLVLATTMTGILDCSTQQLIAALMPGTSAMMPLERVTNWLSVNQTPNVSGSLKGPLDPNLQLVKGDITLTFEPMTKCPGTFSLQGTPRTP